MNVNRCLVLCRYAKHFYDFPASRRWCVGDSHSKGQSATLQARLYSSLYVQEFFGCCFSVCCVATRQKTSGIVHHFHPHGNMANAHTEINQRFALPFSVPAVDIVRPDFKLERSRDTVTGLIPVFLRG